jgi:hypothetical protein
MLVEGKEGGGDKETAGPNWRERGGGGKKRFFSYPDFYSTFSESVCVERGVLLTIKK